MSGPDWVAWHEPYDEPGSPLRRRLELVQRRIREALDAAAPGPIQVISVCSGQGRDLLEVLADHPRRDDVRARMVELDAGNVAYARDAARTLGLDDVECVCGDAAVTATYEGAVPADLVLISGVFGNVSDDDLRHTIRHVPELCRPGAAVIWTRHRRAPDATPRVRSWFEAAGFEEIAFDCEDGYAFGIGTARLVASPKPFDRTVTLFEFVGDGSAANL